MGKLYLKNVFSKICGSSAWSFQIVQVKNSSKNGTSYISREVEIEPDNKVIEFLNSIQLFYISDKGIDSFDDVDDYTGDIVNHVIYKLDKDNVLISQEYKKLIESTTIPNREIELTDIKANAALFKGSVNLDGKDIPVMLVSMQKPISSLTNKYAWIETKKFREIEAPVLTLRKTIDVAIIGDKIYLFSLAGEKLFNMERSYRKMAETYTKDILDCKLVSDEELFLVTSTSGRNPRRYVSFKKEHLEWLKNKKNRKKAADKFGFTIVGDKIDTSSSESAEKLLKFLCNKAMIDPCDEQPVEVANTKPWR